MGNQRMLGQWEGLGPFTPASSHLVRQRRLRVLITRGALSYGPPLEVCFARLAPRPLAWNPGTIECLDMPFYDFLWTDEIVRHLAEHGVSQEDFEHVACNPSSKGYSRSSGLPAAWGYTIDGHYVVVVYEELDHVTILPVTAYRVPEPR